MDRSIRVYELSHHLHRAQGDPPEKPLVGGPPTSPVVRMARGFKQEGLPLAVLWQSPRNRIAFGINSHGTPGLWYVQRQN